MFYLTPTKRGLGAELWGTYDDLRNVYDVIAKFWNQDDFLDKKGFENRDKLVSGFVHEIRKAYEGSRLKREHSHFTLDTFNYFGCQFSWVHILFSLSAIRFNMRFLESDKFDLGMMLQLEYWTERAMRDFDEAGARNLAYYIADGIYQGNPYTYQFMRSINADYFEFGGGKTAFRKLSKLMRRAVYATEEYNSYHAHLILEAQRLECEITDLELSDDNIDYEKIKW